MAAAISIVLGFAAMPASALRVESHPMMATDDTATSNRSTAATPNTETSDDTTSEPNDNLRSQAEQLLKTERQSVKTRTTALRQKACEVRQKSIDTRTGNFATAAQRHLDVFNSIFTKVQTFHDNKKLNVANYTTLVAAATAKQTAAQAAVTTLKALNVQLDCTQPDPAAAVATIKQAVGNARTALQAYRTSLKDLIVALKGASTAQDGGTSTDSSSSANNGGAQ